MTRRAAPKPQFVPDAPCWRCNGMGRLAAPDLIHPLTALPVRLVDCPECDGTGVEREEGR